MKVMIHSNAPWVASGYGGQTAELADRLVELGHEVAVSAYYGVSGTVTDWHGIPVFPAGCRPEDYGFDMLPHWYGTWGADVVIILADAWVGMKRAGELARLNVANWMPLDAMPLSRRDHEYLLASGAVPIAMSRFGEGLLRDAGLRPLYAPHGIDTGVFRPCDDPEARAALRAELGAGEKTFIIGMNAANRDLWRKGFFEQFMAFARFRRDHSDSLLYVHTLVEYPHGLDIPSLVRFCGIEDATIFPDQGPLAAGQISREALVRNFYWALDFYSGCSWGEGFGLPILEAQACGIPVAVTDASAMTELCARSGVKVPGELAWVEGHQACWRKPYINAITSAYWDAWQGNAMAQRQQAAREFAVQYDAGQVSTSYWKPVLEELQARLKEKSDGQN